MSSNKRFIEDIIPIAAVMDDCIIAYDGAMTVGWEIFPSQEYSITQDEYDLITTMLSSAFRTLGEWTVVHRQDIYHRKAYKSEEEDRSFLARCFNAHFEGREYLDHRQFIWFTMNPSKNGKNGVMKGAFSARAYRGPVMKDFETTLEFFESRCSEFIATLTSSGKFKARRVSSEDLEGTPGGDSGLLEQYKCWFGPSHSGTDIRRTDGTYLDRDDRRMFSYSFSQSDDYPSEVSNTVRHPTLSSKGCDVFMSSTSPLGGDLPFEHIVNQYYIFPDQQYALRELDRRKGNMISMSYGSQENTVHAEGITNFIKMIHAENSMAVFSHLNIIAWGARKDERPIRGAIKAALTQIGLSAKLNTVDMPQLFFAGFPGGACEVGEDNYMLCELQQAMCTGINETFTRDLPKGNLRICDRRRHIPVVIDTQQEAYRANLIDNYNAFILGPSGSGKSFFTNWYVRNCYDRGQSIFIIDKGDSYEGLCGVIHEETEGRDGIYYKWSADKPFAFAPFEGCRGWKDEEEGDLNLNFVISLVKMMWEPEHGWNRESESILFSIIRDFLDSLPDDEEDPVFDDFLKYIRKSILPNVEWASMTLSDQEEAKRKTRRKGGDLKDLPPYKVGDVVVTLRSFDLGAMSTAMEVYAENGRFGFLLNNRRPADLFNSRFVVFEVDAISRMEGGFYPLCTFCIIHAFERKMRSDAEGFRLMFIEEAWQAIASDATAAYLKGLWKTARKYHTSATVVTQQVSDIMSSDVIKDAIVGNSPVKILLDQSNNAASIDQIVSYLGLSPIETALVKSVGRGISEGARYKEVFISLGGKRSGVYALEVSPEEALVYETDKQKKRPLLELSRKLGSIRDAIVELLKTA